MRTGVPVLLDEIHPFIHSYFRSIYSELDPVLCSGGYVVIDVAQPQPLWSLWFSGEDRQGTQVLRREVESMLEAYWGAGESLLNPSASDLN